MSADDFLKQQQISRRTFVLASTKISMLCCLLGRLFYLQFFKGIEYKKLSDKNRISLIMIPPKRGTIFDCNGNIMADNKQMYQIKFDRKQVKDYISSFKKLFSIIDFEEEVKQSILTRLSRQGNRGPIVISENISWKELAIIEENLSELPGVFLEKTMIREYKSPNSIAHVTGYIGKISDSDLNLNNYAIDFKIGKNGIEKQYESQLQGKFGLKKMEINAYGLYINELEKESSSDGDNIVTNINMHLQEKIYSMLSPLGSSAIVMEIATGKVISLVSSPSYDPNQFVTTLAPSYWNKIKNNVSLPLINKTIQTTYPPGSAFKVVTALAALENGLNPYSIVNCTGSVTVNNKTFNCWLRTGHGPINLIQAISVSCNCYMYHISKMIGAEAILTTAKKLGLGEVTRIDLPGENKGLIPDANWKLRNFKIDWSLGDAFNIAIGQGPILVTPIQLAKISSIIASDGNIVEPRIVGQSYNKSNLAVNQKNLKFIQEGMFHAVNSYGGTAFNHRLNNIIFAGKTGTSQVQAKKNVTDDLSRANIAWERRNHGLFIGYAPFDKPKYSIAVIVDHGGGGASAAAPIAKVICNELVSLI